MQTQVERVPSITVSTKQKDGSRWNHEPETGMRRNPGHETVLTAISRRRPRPTAAAASERMAACG